MLFFQVSWKRLAEAALPARVLLILLPFGFLDRSLLIAVILFVFANIIPAISLGVRRVRDTGLSPWWYLISVLATILYYLEQSTKQSWLSGLSIILQIIMLVIFLFPTKYFHKNK